MRKLFKFALVGLLSLGLSSAVHAATELQFTNDETNAIEKVQGSDGRLNVSARADSRSFYTSRDDEQAYVLRIEDDEAATNDLVLYLKNTSTTKRLYVTDIHFNVEAATTFKLAFGDAVAATGTAVTPVNMNRGSSNDADVTAFGNGAVGGVAASTFFSTVRVSADGLVEWDSKDALILGQNDNLVIEADLVSGSPKDMEIDLYFFLE